MMNDPLRKIQRGARHVTACLLLALASACETPAPPPAIAAPKPPPATATVEPPATPPAAAAPAAPPPPAAPTQPAAPALSASHLVRASWHDLPGWREDRHARALPALRLSCRVLAKQTAWQDICATAETVEGDAAARAFFEDRFTPYRVINDDGSDQGLVTGYFEPTLRGSRTPSARFHYPLYALPDDLLVLDLGTLTPEFSTAPRVRVDGRRVVPYHTREAIDGTAQPLRGKEIVWLDSSVDAFFLQVQGSGRILLEEGGVMRVGFAGHNGHPYRSIGRVLIERGELTTHTASMQGIKAWAAANPARLAELLNQNARYVFFRELPPTPEDSPPGALGVPLTPRRSIAVDRRYIPLGTPVHIAATWPNASKPLQRLMLAQDIGGAVRGAVRADFFWGAGEDAAREAGRMQQTLRMWVLLPADQPAADSRPSPRSVD
jgi:membrane-bound lytic murein transglycosylase A